MKTESAMMDENGMGEVTELEDGMTKDSETGVMTKPDQEVQKDPTEISVILDDRPMTEEEKAEYHLMMASLKNMSIQMAATILEIRRRKLYREEFKTFDEWVLCYFGKTRQWVTGLSNWVRRQEILERLAQDGPLSIPINGKPAYQIIPKEAEILGPLEDYPEELCRALAEATELCRANPKRKRTRALEETLEKQAAFLRRKRTTPDLSYEEFEAINGLGWDGRFSDSGIAEINKTKADGGDWIEKAIQESDDGNFSGSVLIGWARGQELVDLCGDLKVNAQVRDQLKEAEEAATEAAATLERAKAEITKGHEVESPEDEPEDTDSDDDQEFEEQVDDEQFEEPESSDAYTSIGMALDNLDEVLCLDWPTDKGQLDAILLKAQECEDKLAEIAAKIKELLADAQQPETVSGGKN